MPSVSRVHPVRFAVVFAGVSYRLARWTPGLCGKSECLTGLLTTIRRAIFRSRRGSPSADRRLRAGLISTARN